MAMLTSQEAGRNHSTYPSPPPSLPTICALAEHHRQQLVREDNGVFFSCGKCHLRYHQPKKDKIGLPLKCSHYPQVQPPSSSQLSLLRREELSIFITETLQRHQCERCLRNTLNEMTRAGEQNSKREAWRHGLSTLFFLLLGLL